PAAGREKLVSVMVELKRQPHLLELVLTLGDVGRLPYSLYGWHQQRGQDRNDGDDHQQFHQGETFTTRLGYSRHGFLLIIRRGAYRVLTPEEAVYWTSKRAFFKNGRRATAKAAALIMEPMEVNVLEKIKRLSQSCIGTPLT